MDLPKTKRKDFVGTFACHLAKWRRSPNSSKFKKKTNYNKKVLSGFGFKKHINTSVESWTLILSPVVPHVGSQPPRLPYKPSMWIKNSDLNRREAWRTRTQATGTHTVQVCTGTSKYWLHITSKSCSDQTRLKIWYLPVPYLFPSLPTSICLTHFNLRIWTNQAVMSSTSCLKLQNPSRPRSTARASCSAAPPRCDKSLWIIGVLGTS